MHTRLGLSLQRAACGDVPEGRELIVPLCAFCLSPNHHREQEWLNHSSGCGLPRAVEAEQICLLLAWGFACPFPALMPGASLVPAVVLYSSTVGFWYQLHNWCLNLCLQLKQVLPSLHHSDSY